MRHKVTFTFDQSKDEPEDRIADPAMLRRFLEDAMDSFGTTPRITVGMYVFDVDPEVEVEGV